MKELSSLQNPLVQHLKKLVLNRDYRHEHHSVVLEGETIINEIASHTSLKIVLTVDPFLIPKKAKIGESFLVTPEILRKIAATETPEGILAEAIMPKAQSLEKGKRILVLDGIADPGNMGTLLRTALAFNWDGVFLLPHCADIFNDKALRASRGTPFLLPYRYGTPEELLALMKKTKGSLLGADIEGAPFNTISPASPLYLVIGNESHGLSKAIKETCKKVTIPMKGPMESLNAAIAGGILMQAFGDH